MRYLLLIPSIDIKGGKTVRVVQGIPEVDSPEYGSNPVEMARIWRAENAKMLHVVDFDSAADHSHQNFPIIEEICSSVIIPVEFAGGLRTYDDVVEAMGLGVCRVVIGTMAIDNPKDFKRIFEKYGPQKVAVALDVMDDEIVMKARKIKTGINFKDFAKSAADIGYERFIVTDIKKNGVLGGPNLRLCKKVAEVTNGKVTVSGGVRNKDELIDIQNLIHKGIDSVIVGRALYENKFPCQKLWRVAESGIFH
jgi:phosphoribosylformimino-5-aminoimidazole carboxamide ribotide isomerase